MVHLIAAAAMTPVDIGITAGAVLLLVYSARAMFSKEGKAQLGCGFAVVAAVLWSFALGRMIPNFTWQDGMRLAAGALLLLPALRVFFQHGKGSVVSGAIGLVLASIIAGPVVQRYLHEAGILEGPRSIDEQLTATDEEIDRLQDLSVQLAGDQATRTKRLAERGHSTAEALAADPESMQLMREYAELDARMTDLRRRLETLRAERAKLSAAQADGTRSLTELELDRIRREVVEASDVSEKSGLELFTEQQQLLELFERDFIGAKQAE
jgi:hypothetical protein